MDQWTRRACVTAASVLLAAGHATSGWAQAQPANPAPRGRAAPTAPPAAPQQAAPAVAPARQAAPAAPPALPEPPIPTQHATQAGVTRCVPAIDQLARSALNVPYNAQSLWNQTNPPGHVFQSVAGVKNAKNNPASGMVALIGAPVGTEGCDAVAVEVYPLAGACPEVQKMMMKGGEVESALEDIKVINDAQRRRVFLIPGFGNTCVAVSVNSYFGSP